jgi:hypothetical protein
MGKYEIYANWWVDRGVVCAYDSSVTMIVVVLGNGVGHKKIKLEKAPLCIQNFRLKNVLLSIQNFKLKNSLLSFQNFKAQPCFPWHSKV